MAGSKTDHLWEMIRTHPVRTGLFTVGPVLFGLLQFFNVVANDGSLLFALGFCVVMGIFSAMVTRYHLVTFRVARLAREFEHPE